MTPRGPASGGPGTTTAAACSSSTRPTSEDALDELIQLSLEDMIKRRGGGYGAIHSVKASATYVDQPACALAIATYQVSGWELS